MEDLEFTDDIALSIDGLQNMRCKMEDLIKMNVSKTKLMKVITKQDGTVNIGKETVEEVKEFQQLVSINSKTGDTCEDINARNSEAKHEFALLKTVGRTTSLSLKTKLRIFSSNVKPVLLYG